jgi:hypothetical protein
MEITAFWDIAQWNLVEIDRRFRGTAKIAMMMETVRISQMSIYFIESTLAISPQDSLP